MDHGALDGTETPWAEQCPMGADRGAAAGQGPVLRRVVAVPGETRAAYTQVYLPMPMHGALRPAF